VFTRLLKAKPKRTDIVPKSKATRSDAMEANAFRITWLVNVSTLKILIMQDTQRLNLQARHLNALLSFERLGRLIDSEIMGTTNYKALDLLGDKGIWKEASLGSNVTIYRRNLQRAYIERMSYLMKEE
jgi:hypothetical protein